MSSIVFDIEANGFLEEADTIWCICTEDLDTSKKTTYIEPSNEPVEEAANRVLNSEEVIGHNIICYDIPLLEKITGIKPKETTKVTDTLVLSRLARPDRKNPEGYTGKGGPHSLGAWAYRIGKIKPEHEDWTQFSFDMLRRCREDTSINTKLVEVLAEELKDFSDESIELELQMAKIMHDQEMRGIFFDINQAKLFIEDLTSRINAIDDRITPSLPRELVVHNTVNTPFLKTGAYRKTVLKYIEDGEFADNVISGPFTRVEILPFDLGSVTKVKNYLLDNGWIPDTYNISKTTGQISSPKLEGNFLGVDGEIPKAVKERITWRHRRSQIEGWVKLLREDGSIPAGANPCGTPTSRMRHRGVVNIPKANSDKKTGELIWEPELQRDIYGTQMRSLFIPRPGFKLVGHDASGLELRMLAHYLNIEAFIDEILRGDIHSFNQEMAGLETRDQAKTFIYALIYGAGDFKIGSIVGGDANDGKELKKKYFSSLPELELFIKRVTASSAKGWLRGLDGRRVYMRTDSRGRIERKKAPNTLLQSAGAIVMKRSCVMLWDDIAQSSVEAYKVLDMHDEGQSEVKDCPKHIEPYCDMAVNSIVKAGEFYNLNIPLAAEAKVGYNLAETH